LPQLRVERGRFTEGDWEYGAMSMHDIKAKEQRNAQPRVFDRDPLSFPSLLRPAQVQKASNATGPDRFECWRIVGRSGPVRRRQSGSAKFHTDLGVSHCQLPKLLLQRHLSNGFFD
jgi:hypothetical protein